jgi:hypothetical protein
LAQYSGFGPTCGVESRVQKSDPLRWTFTPTRPMPGGTGFPHPPVLVGVGVGSGDGCEPGSGVGVASGAGAPITGEGFGFGSVGVGEGLAATGSGPVLVSSGREPQAPDSRQDASRTANPVVAALMLRRRSHTTPGLSSDWIT